MHLGYAHGASDFDTGLVAAVAGIGPADAVAAVDRLVERDLVRADTVAGRYRYRHPLVRSAAYQSAGASWRLTAHARAAAALEVRGASAVERAHHVERSALPGDGPAVGVLAEAAQATMHTAPATAADLLRAALRLLPHDASAAPERLRLQGMRARALGVTGRLQESRDALHEVIRLLPAGYAAERAQAVSFCAMVERVLGRHSEARALLEHELASLPDPHSRAATVLTLELLSGRLVVGDFSTDRDRVADAIDTARRCADPALLAAALAMCAMTSYSTGTVDARTVRPGPAISNSFGFGGANTALVLGASP